MNGFAARQNVSVPRLSESVKSEGRLFAFYLGNGTLGGDLLAGYNYLDPADPGLGSALEMAFAIFLNVLETDRAGEVVNGAAAQARAAQYLRSYCDASFVVEPPFEDWETQLH